MLEKLLISFGAITFLAWGYLGATFINAFIQIRKKDKEEPNEEQ